MKIARIKTKKVRRPVEIAHEASKLLVDPDFLDGLTVVEAKPKGDTVSIDRDFLKSMVHWS
jgi:hypothetical protein